MTVTPRMTTTPLPNMATPARNETTGANKVLVAGCSDVGARPPVPPSDLVGVASGFAPTTADGAADAGVSSSLTVITPVVDVVTFSHA
jgi:hypothetical protein